MLIERIDFSDRIHVLKANDKLAVADRVERRGSFCCCPADEPKAHLTVKYCRSSAVGRRYDGNNPGSRASKLFWKSTDVECLPSANAVAEEPDTGEAQKRQPR